MVFLLPIIALFSTGCGNRLPREVARLDLSLKGNQLGMSGLNQFDLNTETNTVYFVGKTGVAVIEGEKIRQVFPLPDKDSGADDVVVDSKRGRVYVTNQIWGIVSLFEKDQFVGNPPLTGDFPEWMAFDPITGYVYVASSHRISEKALKEGYRAYGDIDANITILDGMNQVGSHHLGKYMIEYVVADQAGLVYVASYGKEIFVLKGADIVAQHQLVGTNMDEFTGIEGVQADPLTRNLYVAMDTDLFLFRDGQLLSQTPLPVHSTENYDEVKMAIHPKTGVIYAVSERRPEMALFSAEKDKLSLLRVLPLEYYPFHIGFDPLSGYGYITHALDGRVAVLEEEKVLTTFIVGWYPNNLFINPQNGYVYVANENTYSISVITP